MPTKIGSKKETDLRSALVKAYDEGGLGGDVCELFTLWMQSAWRELTKCPELATIVSRAEDITEAWEANHDDTDAECPFCGHVVTR